MDVKVYSVSSLNKYIKMVFDKDSFLNNVSIKGEITNFKAYSSGHLYFTLKDEAASIKCVMFKGYASAVNFKLADGLSVIISGQISSYERDGIYQLYAKSVKKDGIGDLYTQYEELKEKLKNEGLFDDRYKKKIPFLPSRVGVITSPSGAVIRDIINVSKRRYDKVNLLIYPAAVQGVTTADNVVAGIKELNKPIHNLSVIIIARGGGSFEDLFWFNDEKIARAIFESKLPIISAVGHETDFTICDFVSDLRAPTPSAAAELVYPSKIELLSKLDMVSSRLKRGIVVYIDRKKAQLETVKKQRLEKIPRDNIAKASINIDNIMSKLKIFMDKKIDNTKQVVGKQIALLDSYSPLKTLARGYSTVQNEAGKVIANVKDVNVKDKIVIRVIDGKINAVVTN